MTGSLIRPVAVNVATGAVAYEGTISSSEIADATIVDADLGETLGQPGPGVVLPGAAPAPIATMVTNFASGHGYTANAGGSANLNDTTDFVLGSQSVSIVTDGAGTAKTVKKTAISPAVDATGKIPVVWVKVDVLTKVAALQLYAGDTNLANHYKWELKSSAAQPWITANGWHKIVLSWSEATTAGSPTRSSITDFQYRVVDDATGTVTARFNGIAFVAEPTAWANGVLSLTFDDTYVSHYTEARKKMDQFGYPGTAYTIQDYVGAGGRMTLAQLHNLEDYSGWEVAGHASTAAVHSARFTALSASEMDTEARTVRKWLRSNGFRGDHLAYPGGEFNDTVLAAAEKYFTAGRTTFQKPETTPPARRSKLRTSGYITSATTLASVQTAIDVAQTNKHWIILAFHDLVSSVSASTDWTIADFGSLVDYIATKSIAVRTVGDVLRTKP